MRYLIQFQINIFALAVLGVLLLFMHSMHIRTFSGVLIRRVSLAAAVAIIDEPLTWIFDRAQFPGAYFLEYGTNVLLFLIGPVIGGLLMSYVDYRLFHDTRRIRKLWYYQGASLLTALLLLINIGYPVYFSVNRQTNGYGSGPWKMLHYVILASLYAYMLFLILRHRKRTSPKEIALYSIFLFFPIIGMVTQLIDSRVHFSWTSIVLAVLVMYVFLETVPSHVDYLTSLYNRRSFDSHLKYLVQDGKPFGLLVFDLNSFKQINDRFGHKIGDEVLVGFASALRQTFSRDGIAARLGGDEFAAFIHTTDQDERVAKLQRLLATSKHKHIRNLNFSYGFVAYENGMTDETLYTIADSNMYACKRMMKQQMQR
ncbi:MAG: GGDEF domain-containing protein [Sphaerochaeta sp.]|jgi:diguanylate cyclase (GGDEF)-like protein|nr:GGDEF domain-containing protein [Sphaerochaeta sp.]NCC90098.1 GGDEF domain-containing protein [Spirochaetia bacterium]